MMLFTVSNAQGSVLYDGDSWPMARSALDREILADKSCPQLVIRPEPELGKEP